MRALVLGGTGFLGRHVVHALIARGHEVTLFRRGLSDPGAFPDVEQLTGDREVGLEPRGRRWDVVFDPSGYQPQHVRAAVRATAHDDLHYVFVSSISVYSDPTRPNDEHGSRYALDGSEDGLPLNLGTYGRLKVACERAADEELPGRVRHVRAGLILGPHDYDGRFAWWLRRLARGGEVLAPGSPEQPTQFVDARDLAGWMVACAERRETGAVNATGPATPLPLGALLETIKQTVQSDARLTWVPDEILVAANVRPLSELPFWAPGNLAAIMRTSIDRALASGLTFRPFAETARDTWAWMERDWEHEAPVRAHRALHVPAGMTPEKEASLLARGR